MYYLTIVATIFWLMCSKVQVEYLALLSTVLLDGDTVCDDQIINLHGSGQVQICQCWIDMAVYTKLLFHDAV